eukprot:5460841-Amphidinium_carterae.1
MYLRLKQLYVQRPLKQWHTADMRGPTKCHRLGFERVSVGANLLGRAIKLHSLPTASDSVSHMAAIAKITLGHLSSYKVSVCFKGSFRGRVL